MTVRVNTGALAFQGADGTPFDLLGQVSVLKTAGAEQSWPVRIVAPQGLPVVGRVCAIRKTEEAIRIALEGIRKQAKRKGRQVQPQTLEFARYVIVFTTFPAADFPGSEVLEWYRLRWQVELVFKRFRVAGGAGAPAQARRRERQGVALRQAAGGAAGGEADRPRDRHFPLGISLGGTDGRTAPGVTAISC